MLGLLRGFAHEAYRVSIQCGRNYDINEAQNNSCLGLVPRLAATVYPQWFPASNLYYQFLDACPLRMS